MARIPRRRGDLVYRGLHTTVHFKMNRSGIQAIALSGPVRDATHDWASRVAKPYAISISPRSRETGKKHYADSFVVYTVYVGAPPSTLIIGDPFPMMRAGARLANTAPYAAAVEWGQSRTSRRQRSHRVLGRTLARFQRPVKNP